jgi:hypothetical protein
VLLFFKSNGSIPVSDSGILLIWHCSVRRFRLSGLTSVKKTGKKIQYSSTISVKKLNSYFLSSTAFFVVVKNSKILSPPPSLTRKKYISAKKIKKTSVKPTVSINVFCKNIFDVKVGGDESVW